MSRTKGRPSEVDAYMNQNDDLYHWCCITCTKCSAFLSRNYDDKGPYGDPYCKRCEKMKAKDNSAEAMEERFQALKKRALNKKLKHIPGREK